MISLALPMEAWIGLVGVMVGSVSSGVIALLTNRHGANLLRVQLEHETVSENARIQRERLEELYCLVDKWAMGISITAIPLSGVMQGKLDYNQHMDLFIAQGNRSPVDFTRLEMIIGIYAPALRPQYDKCIRQRTVINSIATAHKKEYERGDTDGQKFVPSFVLAQQEFEAASDELKAAITDFLVKN